MPRLIASSMEGKPTRVHDQEIWRLASEEYLHE